MANDIAMNINPISNDAILGLLHKAIPIWNTEHARRMSDSANCAIAYVFSIF